MTQRKPFMLATRFFILWVSPFKSNSWEENSKTSLQDLSTRAWDVGSSR